MNLNPTKLYFQCMIMLFGVLVFSSWALIENENLFNYQFNQKPNIQQNSEKYDILQWSDILQQNPFYSPSKNNQSLSQNTNFIEVEYQRSFWMWDFTNSLYYKVNTTLLSIGENCYIYMEKSCLAIVGEQAAIQQGDYICDEFDNIIYPRITNLAGHPNGTLGDIDGDPRVIILLSLNLISYYDQRNELNLEYSNQCEMFYIYYRTGISTVAHEFHHLIWFNNEMDEPHFTLEALAEYATYHAGYLNPLKNLTSRSALFLEHPEDSLLHWNMLNSIDYGGAYLFAFYIAEHYGVDILRNLIIEPADGAFGIENVLKRAGNNITFNELYLNWITALTLDELGFKNNLFGFENLDARVTKYTLVKDSSLIDEVKLYYYGFHVHKLQPSSDEFRVMIRKDLDKTIGLSIVFHDSLGWHVSQNLHNKGIKLIIQDISGSEIDDAYIITSYIFDQTPPLPHENGLGPFTYIEISIDSIKGNSLIPFLIISGSFTLILITVLIIIIKKKYGIKN
ncbi:MAG: hypothetical protein ACFE8L_08585 [Candidatus Hodarchaeota archaeon]